MTHTQRERRTNAIAFAAATAALAFSLFMIHGCSATQQSGLLNAKNDLALAQAGLVTANDTTAALLLNGTISPSQGVDIRSKLLLAHASLNNAKTALIGKDPTSASTYIKAATDIIGPILTELAAAAPPPAAK